MKKLLILLILLTTWKIFYPNEKEDEINQADFTTTKKYPLIIAALDEEKEIENNNKMIKKYKSSKENKVRVVTTKNKNIQGILDNGLGKQYTYKDAVYKKYNQNLDIAVKLLNIADTSQGKVK